MTDEAKKLDEIRADLAACEKYGPAEKAHGWRREAAYLLAEVDQLNAALLHDAAALDAQTKRVVDAENRVETAERERDEAREEARAWQAQTATNEATADRARAQLAALVEAVDHEQRLMRCFGEAYCSVPEDGPTSHSANCPREHAFCLRHALASLAPTAKARDEALVAAERARADAAEAKLAALLSTATALNEAWGPGELAPLPTALRTALSATQADVAAWTERVRFDAERRVRAEMNGTPDERIAGLKRRAKELIERDPKEALANVLTALANDPEAIATAEQSGFARALETAAAGDIPITYPPTSAAHMRFEIRAWLRTLSPHPAAPSPAQPVAVGGGEIEDIRRRAEGLDSIAWDSVRTVLCALDSLCTAARDVLDTDVRASMARSSNMDVDGASDGAVRAAEEKFDLAMAALRSALAEHGKVRR